MKRGAGRMCGHTGFFGVFDWGFERNANMGYNLITHLCPKWGKTLSKPVIIAISLLLAFEVP